MRSIALPLVNYDDPCIVDEPVGNILKQYQVSRHDLTGEAVIYVDVDMDNCIQQHMIFVSWFVMSFFKKMDIPIHHNDARDTAIHCSGCECSYVPVKEIENFLSSCARKVKQ